MNRLIFFPFIYLMSACTGNTETSSENKSVSTGKKVDTIMTTKDTGNAIAPVKKYANHRFREVEVTQISGSAFLIKGEAQVFEAAFSWAVEDGHNEIAVGHNTADAGAPAWGKFSFRVEAPKARENSTRTLLLFENSAEDGRRVHELHIPLD